MKKYVFLIMAFTLPLLTTAQYRGGSNDGTAQGAAAQLNALPSIYTGGSNDGHAFGSAPNQNATPSIYTGGSNDGTASIAIASQNASPNIYSGGSNDGVAFASAITQNSSPAIYTGGANDGVAILSVANQNASPGIYLGGLNDGVSAAVATAQNATPSIYTGGANDGYATTFKVGQNSSFPLPVVLLAFSGTWFNDDAVLSWRTGDERDLDHFELERSIDQGMTFTNVGEVAPNTATSSEHEYRYNDVRAYYLPSDVLLYRLKSVATSGAFFCSAIVKLSKDKTAPVFAAYPNPTSGRLTLAIMNEQDFNGYAYVVTSLDGKVIKRDNVTAVTTTIDLSGMPASTYILILLKDGKAIQQFKILFTQ